MRHSGLVAAVCLVASASAAVAQCPNGSQPSRDGRCPAPSPRATLRQVPNGLPRLTATYDRVPFRTLRMELSQLLGRMIVASPTADSIIISARIKDEPWDVALQALLQAHKMYGLEDEAGILTIQTADEFAAQRESQPVISRIVRLQRPAKELLEMVQKRLTKSGKVDLDTLTNSLIITERPQEMEVLLGLLLELDRMPTTKKPPAER